MKKELAKNWILNLKTKDFDEKDKYFDSIMLFDKLVNDNPNDALTIIQDIYILDKSVEVLSNLSAGPLEIKLGHPYYFLVLKQNCRLGSD